jgi:DNA-binding PadR family transcriptional regulator
MYELMILSLLMRGPTHGYNISKTMNDLIGPVLKISHGSLYPRLRRMEEDGLITSAEQAEAVPGRTGTRQARIYTITEQGCRYFHELMMDTTSNPGEYSRLFWQKACHLDCLHPAEQLELIDHYLNYCRTHQLHLKSVTKNVVESKAHYHAMNLARLELTLHALRRATSLWQVEIEYATSLREKMLSKMLVAGEGKE